MKQELSPTRYTLDEYTPFGMAGIVIYGAELEVGVSYGEIYVSEIFFPDQPSETDLIPNAFIKALILSIHSDHKMMTLLYEAAHEEFINNI
jgi:hypothetical protein